MLPSNDGVIDKFAEQRYVSNRAIAAAAYLPDAIGKPLPVEGPAGVGETELGKAVAAGLGRALARGLP